MKRTKITALALALTLTAGVLSGCSAEAEPEMSFVDVAELKNSPPPVLMPLQFGASDSGSSSETEPSDGGTNSASGQSSPDSSEKIIIPAAAEYNVCTAGKVDFDPPKIKNVIFGDVDITPEIRYYDDEPPRYTWEYNGLKLQVDHDSVYLTGDVKGFMRTMLLLPTYYHDGNLDKFEHINDDLDFCTHEEAVKNVRDILAKMDISVYDDYDVYAFHQGDLQAIIEEEIKTGEFYDPKVSMKDPNKQPLDSYTVDKANECYFIVFREEYEDVPIYYHDHQFKTLKNGMMPHPQIVATYSSEGLVGLEIYYYLNNISNTEKVTQVITSESAAQVVSAKYEDVAGIKQVDFKKLELMYVLTPGMTDGKLDFLSPNMIPAWVCTVSITSSEPDRINGGYADFSHKEIVLVDARTGAEII